MPPRDSIINVADCRAQVSEIVTGLRGEVYDVVPAANWEALEQEAIAAIVQQGGTITLSGWYDCPPELEVNALWK